MRPGIHMRLWCMISPPVSWRSLSIYGPTGAIISAHSITPRICGRIAAQGGGPKVMFRAPKCPVHHIYMHPICALESSMARHCPELAEIRGKGLMAPILISRENLMGGPRVLNRCYRILFYVRCGANAPRALASSCDKYSRRRYPRFRHARPGQLQTAKSRQPRRAAVGRNRRRHGSSTASAAWPRPSKTPLPRAAFS